MVTRPVKRYLNHSINTLRYLRTAYLDQTTVRSVRTYSKRLTRMEIQSRRYNIYLARRLGIH